MAARTTAWLVWALLAGSLVFWGLRLGVQPQGLPDQVRTVGADQSARGDILRLFANPSEPDGTAAPQQTAAASRLRLLGVVAGASGADRGWAMLSVDGLPARMIAVGGEVAPGWVVKSVSQRQVEVGPAGGAPVAVLDLPLPNAPQTGQLSPPAGAAVPAAQPAFNPAAPLAPAMQAPQPGFNPAPPVVPQLEGQAAQPVNEPPPATLR
ncbi:hypothetical protein ACWA7J_14880 [Leptothrix sp. BB-4]